MTLGRVLDVANGVRINFRVSLLSLHAEFLHYFSRGPESCGHCEYRIGGLGSTCPPTLGALEITAGSSPSSHVCVCVCVCARAHARGRVHTHALMLTCTYMLTYAQVNGDLTTTIISISK